MSGKKSLKVGCRSGQLHALAYRERGGERGKGQGPGQGEGEGGGRWEIRK